MKFELNSRFYRGILVLYLGITFMVPTSALASSQVQTVKTQPESNLHEILLKENQTIEKDIHVLKSKLQERKVRTGPARNAVLGGQAEESGSDIIPWFHSANPRANGKTSKEAKKK